MSVSRDHYYRLASDLESERISTAATLIKELTTVGSIKEWNYALDRLIKGLSSSRGSARIGFSMCLGEVLAILMSEKKLFDVDGYLLDLSSKLKQSVPKSNGKNERSVLFGELFGVQSLLNSGVIATDLKNGEFESYSKVLTKLIDLSLTKSWIRETCFATIFRSLLQFQIPNHSKFEPILIELLEKIELAGLTLSTEGLLTYLSIPVHKRADIFAKANITQWKNGNPLSKGNLLLVSKILKDVEVVSTGPDDETGNKKKKGSWSPTLHFLWTPLLNELINGAGILNDTSNLGERKNKKQKTSSKQEEVDLETFWKACIDDQFFAGSASPERKYRGFEVFNKVLEFPSLSSRQIETVMSPNLMRTLINQSSGSDRLLNKLAKSTLSNLVTTCANNQDRNLPVLKQLIDVSINFDKLTKTKTTNDIMLSASNDDVILQIVQYLISLENTVDQDVIKYQLFVLDALLHLLRSKKTGIKDVTIYESVLEYLTIHAFMKTSDDAKFTDRMSQLSLERLYSVLSEVMSTNIEREDKSSWPYYVLNKVIEQDVPEEKEGERQYELRNKFEGELNELRLETIEILEAISTLKATGEVDVKLLTCFEVLFSIAMLQLYSGDEESASIISELKLTFEENSEALAGDEPQLVDALVELMLSFVSQKSSLMKRISMIIWENLIEKIGDNQLGRLFEVLLSKENKEGQDKLFNTGGDGELEDDGTDDDDEHDHGSDEDEDEEKDMEVDPDSDSDNEEEDESEDEEDNKNKKLDEVDKNTSIALAKALGIPTSESELEANDSKSALSDSGSSSDEDEDEDDRGDEYESDVESMSDEQMMDIDSTLSQIFKQRRDALSGLESKSGNQRKQEVAEAKEMMIFFKNRVLDLLEVYHTKRQTHISNVDIVITLLDLMDLTLDRHVGEKAHKLIKKITKNTVLFEEEATEDDKNKLLSKMTQVQERAATKSKFQAHSLACNQVSLFIVKSIVKAFGNASIESILGVYSNSLAKWACDKNNKIVSGLYFDLINWLNSKRQQN